METGNQVKRVDGGWIGVESEGQECNDVNCDRPRRSIRKQGRTTSERRSELSCKQGMVEGGCLALGYGRRGPGRAALCGCGGDGPHSLGRPEHIRPPTTRYLPSALIVKNRPLRNRVGPESSQASSGCDLRGGWRGLEGSPPASRHGRVAVRTGRR
jgi:hypothetical protein